MGGPKGKSNGGLLRAAEAAGYEVLVTADRGIRHQQRIEGRRLAILVLHAKTNQLEDLVPLAGAVLRILESVQLGEIVVVR